VSVLPAHEVGRRSVVAEHLHYLTVTLLFPLMVPSDHQAIAWPGAQRRITSRSHHVPFRLWNLNRRVARQRAHP
jgi:hypothetical protein